MEIKKIYRGPVGNQDRFMISTTYKQTKNVRRSLELCKELYLTAVDCCEVSGDELNTCAVACEEVAIDGLFKANEFEGDYEYAIDVAMITEKRKWQKVNLTNKDISPEEFRKRIYSTLLEGATGIEYDSVYNVAITNDSKLGAFFHYLKEINYRIQELGRTLMALKKVEIKTLSDSTILSEQELPESCAISEFADSKGNRYLMIQNLDCSVKTKKLFTLKLKKNFRIYRVNPHDGNQGITKESVNELKILIMPGDADLLRFQDADEEAYLIDYVFKK